MRLFGRGERSPVRWQLVTRHNCHLCDLMATKLEEAGLAFESLDIDLHPELRQRFTDVVPVLLRDGKPVAKVRVSAAQLRRLARRRR